MQATFDLDEQVLRTARDLATRRAVPLDSLVNELLRVGLAARAVPDAELGLPVLVVPDGTPPMDLGRIADALAEGP